MIASENAANNSMSRRTFGKLALGLVASAVPLHASSKLHVGIGTYSYHNLTLDDMIAQLNALHISEIEMSRGEFMVRCPGANSWS